ncbi:hypothetical protein PIB30_065683 [Stylosanthes scabra]|uniref:Uncharacterized protein n=1 Tax=Stylosanthes scabra TaxID=79078 RepID=A0ABU6QMS7_9FABA|nr:hypothetical protein [Stylosanthes scabra]
MDENIQQEEEEEETEQEEFHKLWGLADSTSSSISEEDDVLGDDPRYRAYDGDQWDWQNAAKEGIGSKGFMKRSQEEENRAPCDRKYASCVRTVPCERLGRVSVKLVCKTKAYFFVYSCAHTATSGRN